jgi:hypothetical protein
LIFITRCWILQNATMFSIQRGKNKQIISGGIRIQMGLNKNNGNGGASNIIHIKRGALCLESSEEREGFEHIKDEVDGVPFEKWVQKFGSLDNSMITDIKWYDTEDQYDTRFQGLKIHIHTTDTDEDFLLDLPFAGKAYDAFTKLAENIDFTKPVEFLAYPDKENPKSTVFNVKQDGQQVRQKYTKAYVESGVSACPPAVQNKRTEKWNFDEQREWLLDNLLEKIVPTIPKQAAVEAPAEPKSSQTKGKTKTKTMAATATEDRWAGVEDPIHAD